MCGTQGAVVVSAPAVSLGGAADDDRPALGDHDGGHDDQHRAERDEHAQRWCWRRRPTDRLTTAGAISSATRFITLISGLIAGPAVSLNGSPTVSPMTVAACASLPLPP